MTVRKAGYYEFTRNWAIGSAVAHELGRAFTLVNLVRSGDEAEVLKCFGSRAAPATPRDLVVLNQTERLLTHRLLRGSRFWTITCGRQKLGTGGPPPSSSLYGYRIWPSSLVAPGRALARGLGLLMGSAKGLQIRWVMRSSPRPWRDVIGRGGGHVLAQREALNAPGLAA